MEYLLGPQGRAVLKIYGWTLLLLINLPILILVPISFGAGSSMVFPPQQLSLEWYRELVDDPGWGKTALLSLRIAVTATICALIIGVPAAIGISRLKGKTANIIKMFFVSPMIVPLIVIGVGYYLVLAKLGMLQRILPIALVHAIVVIPFVIMPVLARLSRNDPALERASASLGANPWKTLFTVTLPLLLPAIAAAGLFAFMFSFDEVVIAQFLAGPRFETLPRKMEGGMTEDGLNKAITAIATIQLTAVLLFLFAQWAIGRVREVRAARSGPTRVARSLSAAAVADSFDAETAPNSPPPPVHRKKSTRPMETTQHGYGIRFERLSKYYDGKPAVEDVQLAVQPGEFVTILGPSGSGKTTLLMMVAGFVAPDYGHLLLGDRDISRVPPYQRDIGVVFQSYALFPHMNVSRNVGYPLRVRGTAKSEQSERVNWALSRVQMQDYSERLVSQLSGGQQQRIALARAISFNPRALLMDEPLAALDRNLRQSMQHEIRSLQRSLGQTVVFVTHDQEEALNMSDRVAVMNHGKLQQIATPRDLYHAPVNSFVAEFFGESNLFRGSGSGDVLETEGRKLPLPGQASGNAVLCVRPEVVRLDDPAAPDWAIDGTVTDIRFLGSKLRIELDTAFGTIIVAQPIDGQTEAPEHGSLHKISWEPRMSHLMAS
ncbi:ATP-binding cassette domain-containing protein [Pseudoruegeria sp. HB172150]|uniref:ATP-binding cassette domain-containing protein n=1 Tax=Pseudoruegeria sp. HB172150 TaxID=2721164 RepID=UPI001557EE9B|nr:ATP-binding cassette domain-containing protein [Pseudoruegeria sp. HB172150]